MHEMALTESILQIVEREARRQGAGRIVCVRLEIGALADVEIEALTFCFGVVVQKTMAEGARLEIITLPGKAWCLDCSQSVMVDRRGEACPLCGGFWLQITDGTEMRVREIELC